MITASKFLAESSTTAGRAGCEWVGVGAGAWFGVSLLLNPMLRIEGLFDAGGGKRLGGCVGGFSSSLLLLIGLEGIRGAPFGRGGILGGASCSADGSRSTFGADLTLISGILACCEFVACSVFACSSSARLVGGRGGSLAWSNGGGSFRCVSTDDVLVTEDAVCPSDIPEIVELNDTVEAFEPLRVSCVEVFRGGRFGDACVEFLVGSGGGALRAGSGGVFTGLGRRLSRSTGGGGNRFPFTFLTPIGWLFDCFVTDEP